MYRGQSNDQSENDSDSKRAMDLYSPGMYKLHSLFLPIESPEEVVDLLQGILNVNLTPETEDKKWILTYKVPRKGKEGVPVKVRV